MLRYIPPYKKEKKKKTQVASRCGASNDVQGKYHFEHKTVVLDLIGPKSIHEA